MDTAFLNRVGITSGWGYVDYSFYPDKTKYPWIRRISPFTFLQTGHDRIAGGDEIISVTGVRLSFTRQGFVRVDRIFGQEPWQHQEFEPDAPAGLGTAVPLAATHRPVSTGARRRTTTSSTRSRDARSTPRLAP